MSKRAKNRLGNALALRAAWSDLCQIVAECESRELLRDYLDCGTDSAHKIFGEDFWEAWHEVAGESGCEALDDLCRERLEFLDREAEAAELCFQRAEETRRKNKQ